MKNIYLLIGATLLLMMSCQTPKMTTEETANSLQVETTKANQDISEIKFHKYGGMMGYDESVVLTPFLATYTFRDRSRQKPVVIEQPITKEEWNSIIACAPMQDFKNLKEGESTLPYDGIDTVVSIVKAGETVEKRNVENLEDKDQNADALYAELHRWVDKFRQKVGEEK